MPFQKGQAPWNKGIKTGKNPEHSKRMKGRKLSKEHINKIFQTRKKNNSCWHTEETKKKNSEAHKGVKFSEERKKRASERKMGTPSGAKGKHWKLSEKTKRKMSEANRGEKSYFWKGGITPENAKIRMGIDFRLWREAVFARDNWTCQKTGVKGGKLHPHHIKNFAEYPELRFAINNGITLSEKAHREFHKKYGMKNNTLEQIKHYVE